MRQTLTAFVTVSSNKWCLKWMDGVWIGIELFGYLCSVNI